MVECGEGVRLAPESRQTVGVDGEFPRQDLQRHIPIQLAVAGAEDLAHPARPEQSDDAIRSDVRSHNARSRRGSVVPRRHLVGRVGRQGLLTARQPIREPLPEVSASRSDSTSCRSASSSPVTAARNTARSAGGRSSVAWKTALTCCQRSGVMRKSCRARARAMPSRCATRASRSTPRPSARGQLLRWSARRRRGAPRFARARGQRPPAGRARRRARAHLDDIPSARGDAKEMRATFPAELMLGNQTQVGLVDERGRLQGLPRPFTTELPPRDAAQLAVYDRQELVERSGVPAAPAVE